MSEWPMGYPEIAQLGDGRNVALFPLKGECPDCGAPCKVAVSKIGPSGEPLFEETNPILCGDDCGATGTLRREVHDSYIAEWDV